MTGDHLVIAIFEIFALIVLSIIAAYSKAVISQFKDGTDAARKQLEEELSNCKDDLSDL